MNAQPFQPSESQLNEAFLLRRALELLLETARREGEQGPMQQKIGAQYRRLTQTLHSLDREQAKKTTRPAEEARPAAQNLEIQPAWQTLRRELKTSRDLYELIRQSDAIQVNQNQAQELFDACETGQLDKHKIQQLWTSDTAPEPAPAELVETLLKHWKAYKRHFLPLAQLKGHFASAQALHTAIQQRFGLSLSKAQATGLLNFLNRGRFAPQQPPSPSDFSKLKALLNQLDPSYAQSPQEFVSVWLSELPAQAAAHLPTFELLAFKVLAGRFSSPKAVYEAFQQAFGFKLSKAQATGLGYFFNTGKFDGKTPPSQADTERLKALLAEIQPSFAQDPTPLIQSLLQV